MYASKEVSACTRNLYEADGFFVCHLLFYSIGTVCKMKSCSLHTKEAFFTTPKTYFQSTNPGQSNIIKPHIPRLRSLQTAHYNPHIVPTIRCQRSRTTKLRPLLHLDLSILLLDKARQRDVTWSSNCTIDFDAEGCRVGACFADLRYLTRAGEEAGSSGHADALATVLRIGRGHGGVFTKREQNPGVSCSVFEARVYNELRGFWWTLTWGGGR